MYRVEIENEGKPNTRKMVRINHNNYYTSTDLNMSTKLKLNINMLENEEFNILSNGKGTTITGSVRFKSFADMLYKMRCEHKNNDFKKTLNLAWGTLCATNIHTFQYDLTKDFDVNINLDPERPIILSQFCV